jgi:predicted CXXCH cytochrome family protein
MFENAQIVLVLLTVVAAVALAMRHRNRISVVGIAGLSLALLVPVVFALSTWSPPERSIPEQIAPSRTTDQGFVSSDTCRACHPAQYESWKASYHRSMTQVASPESIAAPQESTTLTGNGRTLEVSFVNGSMHVDDVAQAKAFRYLQSRPAPLPPGFPRAKGEVVMTTGSHHMQIYWMAGPRGGLEQLSWTWLIRDQRWVPGEAVYLQPPEAPGGIAAQWETNCIRCHATGPQPRLALGGREHVPPDPRVGELGIGCESCHGPAEAHVEANRDPLRRYRQHLSNDPDPTIVNPKRLPSDIASEICARCHSGHAHKKWDRNTGEAFVPGDRIARFFRMRRYENTPPGDRPHYFWEDGTSRVTGREYTAMAESACFRQGELSCGSCHSMHDSDPDDQLAIGESRDEDCLQCHSSMRDRIEEHTHHSTPSSGSRCVNCHMPNTTYGILSVTRSHRIDNPSAAKSAETGRPNACNLCHVDRSLAWADQHLSTWFDNEPSQAFSKDERMLAAGPVWALSGDAVQRAVANWHLGWGPSIEATGPSWRPQLLVESLDDPYVAVRYLAERALRQFSDFAEFNYDFTLPGDEQRESIAVIRTRARSVDGRPSQSSLRGRIVDRLRENRDDTPVTIWE